MCAVRVARCRFAPAAKVVVSRPAPAHQPQNDKAVTPPYRTTGWHTQRQTLIDASAGAYPSHNHDGGHHRLKGSKHGRMLEAARVYSSCYVRCQCAVTVAWMCLKLPSFYDHLLLYPQMPLSETFSPCTSPCCMSMTTRFPTPG